jgi:DNA-directed RNA polymerase subunit H (RpoH/RPB5)
MDQTTNVYDIYKSRKILLDILKARDFNVDDYSYFTVGEISTMQTNKQLDMLVTQNSSNKKIYVKYHLAKTLRQTNIYELIEDLYTLDVVLTPKDDLMIIMKDKPNETLLKLLNDVWQQENIFISVFHINKLLFNITEHELVPPHRVLSEEEDQVIRKKYNIEEDSNMPDISRFSLIAQAIGLRPGQICEIVRPSKTAITAKYYRICS